MGDSPAPGPQPGAVHSSGFQMSPYADIKPAGEDAKDVARKLWHRSPGARDDARFRPRLGAMSTSERRDQSSAHRRGLGRRRGPLEPNASRRRHRRRHRRLRGPAGPAGPRRHRRRPESRRARGPRPARRRGRRRRLVTGVQGDLTDSRTHVARRPPTWCSATACSRWSPIPPPRCAPSPRCSATGGLLSLLVAQRHAAVVARAMAGHFQQALALLDDPCAGPRRPPLHRRRGRRAARRRRLHRSEPRRPGLRRPGARRPCSTSSPAPPPPSSTSSAPSPAARVPPPRDPGPLLATR
jgi:hypothetical protein